MRKTGLRLLTGCLLVLLAFTSNSYGVSLWTSHNYYRAGSLVIHDDGDDALIKYRAIKPSRNKVPSANSDYWKAVSTINKKNQIIQSDEGIVPALPPPLTLPTEDTVLPGSEIITEDGGSADLPNVTPEPASTVGNDAPVIPEVPPFEANQPTAGQNTGEWSAGAFYLAGQLIQYKGSQYQARWSNSGMIPGKTDAWVIANEPGSYHRWQRDHIYPIAGLRVLYEDHIYENNNWSLNDEPGRSPVWIQVDSAHFSDISLWSASRQYIKGDLVTYGDYIYRNRWSQSNQIPGKTDAWIIVYEEGKDYFWHSDHVYPMTGNQVIFNDKMYVNSRWTLGEEPGTSTVWTLISDANVIEDWQPNGQYNIDDLVKYNNRYYVSLKNNLNEEPGETDAWSLSDHDGTIYSWIKDHTYPKAGVKVRYLNKVYQNLGWTRGDVPDQEASSVWELVTTGDNNNAGNTGNDHSSGNNGNGNTDSDHTYDSSNMLNCESPEDNSLQSWQPSNSYLLNDKVKHTVQLAGDHYTLSWQSRWWINPGEEPGFNSGWVLLLVSDGRCPWSPNYTYSDADGWKQVVHNGKVYLRKFWNLNDEPGVVLEYSSWELIQ